MIHIQAHEHPKIVVHERAGVVRDYSLCEMMSMVYTTKADAQKMGWRLLGCELWDLIRQLPGCRNGFNGQDNWIVRPISWRCVDSC